MIIETEKTFPVETVSVFKSRMAKNEQLTKQEKRFRQHQVKK